MIGFCGRGIDVGFYFKGFGKFLKGFKEEGVGMDWR